MTDISVIVPVYNMAENGNLRYCLDSLVGQTLESLEIIAVDDASTDDSFRIVKEYEAKYPGRVVAIASPENRRQGGARNLGLKAAKGRYIGFMDSDDWADPSMFEKMLNKALETGADVVGTNMCRVYEHTMVKTGTEECNDISQVGEITDESVKALLLHPGPVVTKLYARDIFFEPEFKFPEKMAYEDNAVFADLIMRYHRFEIVPEALYYYYQNPDSTTHAVNRKNCEDRMAAMRLGLDIAKSNGALDRYPDEVCFQFFNLFYKNTLMSYMLSPVRKELSFIKALGDEMKEAFPDFQENKYYLQNTNDEEKKLISLQQASSLRFLIWFSVKKAYRTLRYGKW